MRHSHAAALRSVVIVAVSENKPGVTLRNVRHMNGEPRKPGQTA